VYNKEKEDEEDTEEVEAVRHRRNLQTPDSWDEPITGKDS